MIYKKKRHLNATYLHEGDIEKGRKVSSHHLGKISVGEPVVTDGFTLVEADQTHACLAFLNRNCQSQTKTCEHSTLTLESGQELINVTNADLYAIYFHHVVYASDDVKVTTRWTDESYVTSANDPCETGPCGEGIGHQGNSQSMEADAQ